MISSLNSKHFKQMIIFLCCFGIFQTQVYANWAGNPCNNNNPICIISGTQYTGNKGLISTAVNPPNFNNGVNEFRVSLGANFPSVALTSNGELGLVNVERSRGMINRTSIFNQGTIGYNTNGTNAISIRNYEPKYGGSTVITSLDNSGTIEGSIHNYGTIISMVNSGILGKPIYNFGTILAVQNTNPNQTLTFYGGYVQNDKRTKLLSEINTITLAANSTMELDNVLVKMPFKFNNANIIIKGIDPNNNNHSFSSGGFKANKVFLGFSDELKNDNNTKLNANFVAIGTSAISTFTNDLPYNFTFTNQGNFGKLDNKNTFEKFINEKYQNNIKILSFV